MIILKKIVIYVSDHGFGHAARTIALVRQLKKYNYEIIVKNSNAYNFLKSQLPEYKIIKTQTDVGPLTNIFSNSPDYEKTFSLYNNWIDNSKKWIDDEVKFFKNKKIDLIISDISPISIRLANKLGIPCITIANFTWIDILENFPHHKYRNDIINWLYDSFEMSTLPIRLPLHMKLKGLRKPKNSSLLFRKTTSSKNSILKNLGIKDKPITVYLGTNNSKLRFITNNKTLNIIHVHPKYIKINNKKINNSIDIQNLISASKLVITKPGYGVFSECIASRCPMLVIPQKNYPEAKVLCKHAKKFGISTIVNMNENFTVNLRNISTNELFQKINEHEIQKIMNLPSTDFLVNEFLQK
jgi:UDP:flavonoid glycosyltransferase YjiC (YdhE family)